MAVSDCWERVMHSFEIAGWLGLLFAGWELHDGLGLPGWLVPPLALAAFAPTVWRHRLPGARFAVAALGLAALGGYLFRFVEDPLAVPVGQFFIRNVAGMVAIGLSIRVLNCGAPDAPLPQEHGGPVA